MAIVTEALPARRNYIVEGSNIDNPKYVVRVRFPGGVLKAFGFMHRESAMYVYWLANNRYPYSAYLLHFGTEDSPVYVGAYEVSDKDSSWRLIRASDQG